MSFKECLEKDSTAFLNIKEFGEEHILDGRIVTIIVDEDIINERENRKRATEYAEGVYSREFSIFVCSNDFENIPVFGQIMVLDGESFFVTSVLVAGNIVEITLGANES